VEFVISVASGLADLGIVQSLGVAIVTLAAGTLRGFTGFGSSLLLVPVLALVIGPTTAVVIGTLLEALATMMLGPSSVVHANGRRLVAIGVAGAVAIPVGHFALLKLDPSLSNVAISAAVVVMSGLVWRGAGLRLPRGPGGEAGTGLISGFLTGFGSIGGPPLVLYVLAGGGSAVQKRADVIVVAGFLQAIAVVSMTVFGLLTFSGAGGAALLAPVFFAGGVLGARLFAHASEQTYQRVALGSLFVAAAALLCMNVVRLVR
jgi:uncharacterized membrane protein YfcA